ncbi:MAG: DUF2177 family protein [Devosia sp.]|jgi:uncharacterized membrane protein|uniref:DUF2177 family protein n=1 Tax=Devosia sp. TaxID=1871048 RepID=UPI0037C0CE26
MNYVILYIASAVVFFAADFVWLSTMGDRLYRPVLGDMMLDKPNLPVAAGFYLLYLVGLVVLVTAPANGDIFKALWMGALFGFVAYGTYDLTNLATLRNFTPTLVAIDMAWGTVLTGVSAAAGVWISKFFA